MTAEWPTVTPERSAERPTIRSKAIKRDGGKMILVAP